MKHRVKGSLVLLLLVIIAALGILFYQSLSWRYEMRGEVADLSGLPMESSGYEVVFAGGGPGKSFTVTGEDPQFILTVPNIQIGGIELVLDNPWQAQEPLPVQVFYAKPGEAFSEKHSVKNALRAGEVSAMLPVPLGQYQTLRFDIDGDFALAAVRSCSAPMAAQAYVSGETAQKCLWYFPAVVIGFSLIYWAHGVRMRQGGFRGGAYLKSIFLGVEPSTDRAVYLDYLRVLAAVLVILAHTCSPMVDAADAPWKRLLLVLGLSLGLCCNILYVMLSGTLLLGGSHNEEEGVLTFYIRRASKVIIPLTAYYLLLLYLNHEVGFLPPKQIGAALKRIITGAPDVGPHLWLIYTIAALYLVTPFFRVMVQHMSDRLLTSLAAVILVLNTLTTYLPLCGMAFGASTFLAGWEGGFLLGYILTRHSGGEGAPRAN
ncbi:MAG: acyltransferase, partial [Lachnospiraceae bacterium]|nr:acyltransferase [Lachnospiraceae bacterium]